MSRTRGILWQVVAQAISPSGCGLMRRQSCGGPKTTVAWQRDSDESLELQLFLLVLAKNGLKTCMTLAEPHLGHLGRFFPCCEIVSTRENSFRQFSQRYS